MEPDELKILTAVPVFNEAAHIDQVLNAIAQHAENVLVVDDGSTDETPELLAHRHGVHVARHAGNRGYGAALRTAFAFARHHCYDVIITLDCDGQHQPHFIPGFIAAIADCDIVSGSRYLHEFDADADAPADRMAINRQITAELNRCLGLQLTDAFCGFKAYRVTALNQLRLTENGYAMPLEFWVQAAKAGLVVRELAVPRIYLDEKRSFGGVLDDAEVRLAHYREVLAQSLFRAHEDLRLPTCSELAMAYAWECQ